MAFDLKALLERADKGALDLRSLKPDFDEEELLPPKKKKKKKPAPEDVAGVGEKDELVVEGKVDDLRVRQAGADAHQKDTQLIQEFRSAAERNLFVFAKSVLKKWWLTKPLHTNAAAFLQDFTSARHKLLLLPREHGKTSLVCDSLPLHLIIQPRDTNVYMGNMDGSTARILLCCETISRACDHVRVLQDELEGNKLLRAFWPERVWQGKARKEAKTWTKEEFVLPRPKEYPDPTVRGLGVGSAVAGMHPNILIKDDLISFEAANSPAVMQTAIDWHGASRALVSGQPKHIEVMIGTRWAVQDLYSHVIENDRSVEVMVRRAIEEGQVIYPIVGNKDDGTQIGFTRELLDELRKRNPVLFALNYMNDASNPDIIDFPREKLRFFTQQFGEIVFERTQDDEDLEMLMRVGGQEQIENVFKGLPLTNDVLAAMREQLRGNFRVVPT